MAPFTHVSEYSSSIAKLPEPTFGYLDPSGRRTRYAYPMKRVRNELATALHKLPEDLD